MSSSSKTNLRSCFTDFLHNVSQVFLLRLFQDETKVFRSDSVSTRQGIYQRIQAILAIALPKKKSIINCIIFPRNSACYSYKTKHCFHVLPSSFGKKFREYNCLTFSAVVFRGSGTQENFVKSRSGVKQPLIQIQRLFRLSMALILQTDFINTSAISNSLRRGWK